MKRLNDSRTRLAVLLLGMILLGLTMRPCSAQPKQLHASVVAIAEQVLASHQHDGPFDTAQADKLYASALKRHGNAQLLIQHLKNRAAKAHLAPAKAAPC